MSSRIFQSIIVQMKDATSRSIGVIDTQGMIVASSELSLIGMNTGYVPAFFEDDTHKTIRNDGRTYKSLGTGASDDYTVFTEGEDDLARTICVMAAVAINEAGVYFEENHDKRAFVKNIISENVLPIDMHVRAKELRFPTEATRAVLVIRNSLAMEASAIELLQGIFPDKQNDFVISLNDTDVAIIKEVSQTDGLEAVHALAEDIEQKLASSLSLKIVIGIGTLARQMRELSDRYKEALMAIDVGRVFDSDKTVLCYENLGIGRLIYQLPTTLCEIFLSEVFKMNPIEALDKETLFTIDKFFENSLNVSETSRKLFVHRNTLVYRLEKIKKITGLDLREFDHAIIFKVALMVKKYLVSQESKF